MSQRDAIPSPRSGSKAIYIQLRNQASEHVMFFLKLMLTIGNVRYHKPLCCPQHIFSMGVGESRGLNNMKRSSIISR